MPNNLSQGAKDLLVKVRQIVPPLLEKFHKGEILLQMLPIPNVLTWARFRHPPPPGQMGRVAVIGGSAKCVLPN